MRNIEILRLPPGESIDFAQTKTGDTLTYSSAELIRLAEAFKVEDIIKLRSAGIV